MLDAGAGVGARTLVAAAALTRRVWGERRVAAYALGSLAHGGFSIHVSDVDLGVLLQDPLQPEDSGRVDRLLWLTKEANAPLADRLSVFWGSAETLAGRARGGRFPAADREDLKNFGYLLEGLDLRDQLAPPNLRELISDGAELALLKLSSDAVIEKLKDPAALAASGPVKLTKWLLFPIRLLLTSRTGRVAGADLAVQNFCATKGPACELARKALEWRYAPPDPHDPHLIALVGRGALPLYAQFLCEYESQLRALERIDLAEAFRDWGRRLCDA
jgi:predicted nucleotidyltransferase